MGCWTVVAEPRVQADEPASKVVLVKVSLRLVMFCAVRWDRRRQKKPTTKAVAFVAAHTGGVRHLVFKVLLSARL